MVGSIAPVYAASLQLVCEPCTDGMRSDGAQLSDAMLGSLFCEVVQPEPVRRDGGRSQVGSSSLSLTA